MYEFLSRLRVPVVSAPMFLVSGPELVVAACRAGVIGAFPSPNCRTLEELDEWMGVISSRVDPDVHVPWAVNLVTHRTNTRLPEDLKLVEEYRPPIVISALGSPAPVMDVVKNYGGTVIADVTTIGLARKAAALGVDGLACISAGAGGHTGHLSPFAFVSAVREFFDGIVAVGGGIADGHGVAGAIASGADLVWMGTRFLATHESRAPVAYKEMVRDNGPDDLIVTDGVTGTSASWLRPSLLQNGFDPDNMVPLVDSRNYDTANSPKRWRDIWAAGQGLQTISQIESVEAVVVRLEREYVESVERLSARSAFSRSL